MPRWSVRLARAAEQDYEDILLWTHQQFGPIQAQAYAATLSQAISALVDGPKIAGVKPREDIGPAIHTLHVARLGRKGRHFVVFQCTGNSSIDILRLLHDSMDLPQHDLGE
ncbi:type II toxin-antitoxin system RelE/ParE family toxin [Rhodoferax lacus]|uniref:Type II toxin-antitoxin system RelE/ParE family toxin n=2 Tax=Rhodoferax lacus TaxID=2184758 RepID=A0A3E1RDU1_9BURK|nr:type II toxin-antitoxin system RelE/ParE family toxin [Rhodoferax lacus]